MLLSAEKQTKAKPPTIPTNHCFLCLADKAAYKQKTKVTGFTTLIYILKNLKVFGKPGELIYFDS